MATDYGTGKPTNPKMQKEVSKIAKNMGWGMGQDRAIKSFIDTFGTWENAVKAVSNWKGGKLTPKQTKAIIHNTLGTGSGQGY